MTEKNYWFLSTVSRFLRAELIDRKSATHTRSAFQIMSNKKHPRKYIYTKTKTSKGNSPESAWTRTLSFLAHTVSSNLALPSATLWHWNQFFLKILHENNTIRCIDQLESFVSLINSRLNRTTKVAPKTVTSHDVPFFVSLSTNAKSVRKGSYKIGKLFE